MRVACIRVSIAIILFTFLSTGLGGPVVKRPKPYPRPIKEVPTDKPILRLQKKLPELNIREPGGLKKSDTLAPILKPKIKQSTEKADQDELKSLLEGSGQTLPLFKQKIKTNTDSNSK